MSSLESRSGPGLHVHWSQGKGPTQNSAKGWALDNCPGEGNTMNEGGALGNTYTCGAGRERRTSRRKWEWGTRDERLEGRTKGALQGRSRGKGIIFSVSTGHWQFLRKVKWNKDEETTTKFSNQKLTKTYSWDSMLWAWGCIKILGLAQITPLFYYKIFYYKIITMLFCNITISYSSTPYDTLGEMFKWKL